MHGTALAGSDRYRLIEPIGAGGMAVVYRGHDTRMDVEIAIKLLAPQFVHNPKVRERFRREGVTQARLQHPNIVRATDLVEASDQLAIIMDFVHGRSLDTWLAQQGPLSIAAIRELMDPVFEAVAFAHEQGVIHRDLKPGNIVLDESVSPPKPMVMDFGIAKLADALGGGFTRTGAVMGTPVFMPPEQLRGASIDRRVDVYALGVTVYQMATGRLPYCGRSEYEVSAAVLSGQPPAAPSSVAGHLTPAFDRLVAAAMSLQLDARIPDVPALQRELARLAGTSTAMASTPLPKPTLRPETVVMSAEPAPARPLRFVVPAIIMVAVAGVLIAGRGGDDPIATPPVPQGQTAAARPAVDEDRAAPPREQGLRRRAIQSNPNMGYTEKMALPLAQQPKRRVAEPAPEPPRPAPAPAPAPPPAPSLPDTCICRGSPPGSPVFADCKAAPFGTPSEHEERGVRLIRQAEAALATDPDRARRLARQAANELKCVVDARPSKARHWGDYGWALHIAGSRVEARRAQEHLRSLTSHPNLLAASSYSLALLACDAGDPRGAEQHLIEALRLKTAGAGVATREARLAEIRSTCNP